MQRWAWRKEARASDEVVLLVTAVLAPREAVAPGGRPRPTPDPCHWGPLLYSDPEDANTVHNTPTHNKQVFRVNHRLACSDSLSAASNPTPTRTSTQQPTTRRHLRQQHGEGHRRYMSHTLPADMHTQARGYSVAPRHNWGRGDAWWVMGDGRWETGDGRRAQEKGA